MFYVIISLIVLASIGLALFALINRAELIAQIAASEKAIQEQDIGYSAEIDGLRSCMAFGFSGRGLDGTHAAADSLLPGSRRTSLGVRWPWRRISHRSL